jgi:hypothetical protein
VKLPSHPLEISPASYYVEPFTLEEEPHDPPLPAAFHVCQESRCEMQALYTALQGTSFHAARPGQLVNWETDTIFCADVLFRSHNYYPPRYVSSLSSLLSSIRTKLLPEVYHRSLLRQSLSPRAFVTIRYSRIKRD